MSGGKALRAETRDRRSRLQQQITEIEKRFGTRVTREKIII
jgi:hypothetical protein